MSMTLLVSILAGVVSLLSALIAVAGVVFTGMNARKIELMRREAEFDREARERAAEMKIYSAPLASAAFDLQSRIYNILEKRFVEAYISNGTYRSKKYAIDNTSFLISQLFCWFELTRNEIHYIELDSEDKTRELLRLQDRLRSEWATDKVPASFCIFAGEQRAIGEALIIGPPDNTTCMGYGTFVAAFPPGSNAFIDDLRADVASLGQGAENSRSRLGKLQRTLLEILDLFDPEALRFPRNSRFPAGA